MIWILFMMLRISEPNCKARVGPDIRPSARMSYGTGRIGGKSKSREDLLGLYKSCGSGWIVCGSGPRSIKTSNWFQHLFKILRKKILSNLYLNLKRLATFLGSLNFISLDPDPDPRTQIYADLTGSGSTSLGITVPVFHLLAALVAGHILRDQKLFVRW